MTAPISDLFGGPQPCAAPGTVVPRLPGADSTRAVGQPGFPTFASLVTRILNGQPIRATASTEEPSDALPVEETSDNSDPVVDPATISESTTTTTTRDNPVGDQALGALRSFVELHAAQPEQPKDARPSAEPAGATPSRTETAHRTETSASAVPPTRTVAATRVVAAGPAESVNRGAAVKASADAIRHRANVDPGYVVRDLSVLNPELRTRVERVMERMQDEFGHKVSVVETWRSQSRQDALFEQGRTRPGQVVTWVKESTHQDGRAADLLVDGHWTNPVAYKRLQQIAGEEGLRTLGMRDRGHVELRQSTPSRQVVQRADIVAQKANAVVAPLAKVAVPAPVAPAQIAAAATVEPPAPAKAQDVSHAEEPPSDHAQSRDTEPQQAPKADAPNRVVPPTAARSVWRPERRREALPNEAEPAGLSARPSSHTQQPSQTAAPLKLSKAFELSPAARLERIAELNDLAESRPMSGMMLHIDTADGGTDRIRLGVQGTQVAAQIDVGDSARALSLGDRIPELVRALESRGFESTSVHLRAPTLTTPATSAGAGSDAGARNDSRPSPDDGAFRSPNNPFRQRSRRDRGGNNQ